MSTVADKLARKSSTRRTSNKQVRLRLVYVDFWSALKLGFLAGIAVAIMTVVAILLVFFAISASGLIPRIDEILSPLVDDAFALGDVLTLPQVLSFAAILAILNLVVITILGAIAAAIYNLMVKVSGGLLVGFTSN